MRKIIHTGRVRRVPLALHLINMLYCLYISEDLKFHVTKVMYRVYLSGYRIISTDVKKFKIY